MKARLLRAWGGFTRPLTLVAGLRGAALRRYLVTASVQAVLTLALGVGLASLDDEGLLTRLRGSAGLREGLEALALLWSALLTSQWLVLAFGREFHNPLGRALAEVAHIPPEDGDAPPRVRLEWRWLKKKLTQKARGLLVLLPGFALLVPVQQLTRLLDVEFIVMPVLMGGWSFYWWCAFTAGRSERAWRDTSGALPAPHRWWLARTTSTPGFRWFLPRWLGAFAAWATKRDAPPALALERDPPTFFGLGLSRLVLSVPLVRLYFRAAVDVAAAEALVRLDTTAPPAPSSRSA